MTIWERSKGSAGFRWWLNEANRSRSDVALHVGRRARTPSSETREKSFTLMVRRRRGPPLSDGKPDDRWNSIERYYVRSAVHCFDIDDG